MSFTSPNMHWEVPTVGADRNTWGRFLNAIFSTDTQTSLDSCLFKLFNTNIGATAPTYPDLRAGRMWVDTTNTPIYKLKIYDGTVWVEIGEIDINDHTFVIPGSTFVVGQMIMWAGIGAAPVRWVKCNGADLSRTTYVALFEALTFTATGDTANGSPIIQNLSSLDGIYVGMNLEVNGLVYPATVLSIDDSNPLNLKITCSANLSVTAATVTVRFLPYGASTLNTNFKLPDLKGRVAKASGDNGNTLDYITGISAGQDFITDILDHTHLPPSGSGTAGFPQTMNGYVATIPNGSGAGNAFVPPTTGNPFSAVNGFAVTGAVDPTSISGSVRANVDVRNPWQTIDSYIIYAGV